MSLASLDGYVIPTVTAPSESFDLTTLAAVKIELDITETADDEWLGTKITEASEQIADYCNRVFAQQGYQDQIRLPRGLAWSGVEPDNNPLLLRNYPVSAIASVTETTLGVSTVLTQGTDFEADLTMGWLYRLHPSSGRRRYWRAEKIVVLYTAGWVLPSDADDAPDATLPSALSKAAKLMVKYAWFGRTRDPALRSETVDNVASAAYFAMGGSAADLPSEVEAMVYRYRILPL